MDGYFVYEYMLSYCLVSYMFYRWLFSVPMSCLESLKLFIGLNGDLNAVVFKDLAHFFFYCFYLLGRFCAGCHSVVCIYSDVDVKMGKLGQ